MGPTGSGQDGQEAMWAPETVDRMDRSTLFASAGNETPGLWSSQQPCHCPECVKNNQNQMCR